jgi:hypothetical protein
MLNSTSEQAQQIQLKGPQLELLNGETIVAEITHRGILSLLPSRVINISVTAPSSEDLAIGRDWYSLNFTNYFLREVRVSSDGEITKATTKFGNEYFFRNGKPINSDELSNTNFFSAFYSHLRASQLLSSSALKETFNERFQEAVEKDRLQKKFKSYL